MKLIWLRRHSGKGDNQPDAEPGKEKAKADLFRRTCDSFDVTDTRNLAEELAGRRFAKMHLGYCPGMKFKKRRGYRILELEYTP